MKPVLKSLCFLIILGVSALSLTLSDGQQGYAGRCIKAIINCDYDSAFFIADSVSSVDSADPLAPLFRLTAIGVRDIDFDTLIDSVKFLQTYRTVEERITAYEKTNGVSSFTKMLSGFSKGFYATFFLREKSYFAAMRNGFQSLDLLQEAYRLDSTNADPLFLPGLYEYAKGELKRRLWWVLFWYPGSKKTGIERLKHCMNNGCFAASPATFALAEIYVRENKPDECSRLVERLERDFPDSRFMLWAKAKYSESRRLYYEASLCYELLAASYAAEPAGRFNAFYMRNLQAHMLLLAGQNKEAADSCRVLLREKALGREIPVYHDTKKLLQRINDGENQ
jgi:hypothetical protein